MAKPRKFRNSDGSTSWKITVSVRGFHRVTRSFAAKGEAQEWHDSLVRSLKDKRKKVASDWTKLTLKSLVDKFLETPETKDKRYFENLSQLLAWWVNQHGNENVRDFIGPLTLREARDRHLMPGRSRATVNRYLSALRACWNWARGAGVVPNEHAWPPKLMLAEPKERTRFLSDDELAAVLKAARDHSLTVYVAIFVSIACGMRQGELLRLTWADIDLDANTIRVLLTKNGESRSVYLPSSAVAALREIKRGKIVGTRVFLDEAGQPVDKNWLMYHWRLVRAAAKLRDFRWHDLRHSCASLLAQNGSTLLEIGAVLGHKSPSATARYAHLVAAKPVTGHAKLDEKLAGKS